MHFLLKILIIFHENKRVSFFVISFSRMEKKRCKKQNYETFISRSLAYRFNVRWLNNRLQILSFDFNALSAVEFNQFGF